MQEKTEGMKFFFIEEFDLRNRKSGQRFKLTTLNPIEIPDEAFKEILKFLESVETKVDKNA